MQNSLEFRDCLVSVIVPNFNYGRYLGTCISSILDQTYQPIEIIVVDDGSTDDSLEVIKSFSSSVHMISQKNQGVNSARNLGILNSAGSFIALCDSDDYWEPEKIQKQMNLLLKDESVVLVGSSIKYFSSEGQEFEVVRVKEQGDLSMNYCRNPGMAWIPGASSSSLFRRADALSIGLFDENLKGNAEDWEFFARLSFRGNFAAVVEPLVHVRIHPSSRSVICLPAWYEDNRRALSALNKKSMYKKRSQYLRARLNLEATAVKTLLKTFTLHEFIFYLKFLLKRF